MADYDQVVSRFDIVKGVLNREFSRPYRYGSSDCFFLALAMIDALQSTELSAEYSGIYSSFTGAQRAMKIRGFASIGDLFAKHLEVIVPAKAVMGDVVVIEVLGREHSAICLGGSFVTRNKTGQSHHAIGAVKSAFKV